MSPALVWIVVGALALAASVLATGLMLRVLRARAILDHPNARSSHEIPTPVGAGIAVIGVIAFEWLVVWALDGFGRGAGFSYPVPLIVGLALTLGAVSWIDDVRRLGVVTRLAVQAAAVLIGIAALSAHGRIFQGLLPYGLDVAVTALAWLWFINLTNFMDGIDGIAGTEAACIGAGIALLAPWVLAAGAALGLQVPPGFGLYALIVAAAAAGFLVWNWQPAKIFLGDVGAVPLGFILGWLLLEVAGAGLWAAALILPLYYLADSSLTLLRRILRRERIFDAHRSHAYQAAARRFGAHAPVVVAIFALNILLIALAFVASTRAGMAVPALIVAAVLTAALLWYFGRDPRSEPDVHD